MTPTEPSPEQGSLLRAALWMLVLSLALFWLPVVGPLIAGFVGGRIVGRVGPAVFVALLPAIALAAVIVLVLSVFDLPVLGAVAGVGIFVVVAVQDVPLIVGAWAGAAFS